MQHFDNPSAELKLFQDNGQSNSLSEAAQSLYREAKMISLAGSNAMTFETFLKDAGSDPLKIRRGILSAPPSENGAAYASFIIFRPLERAVSL